MGYLKGEIILPINSILIYLYIVVARLLGKGGDVHGLYLWHLWSVGSIRNWSRLPWFNVHLGLAASRQNTLSSTSLGGVKKPDSTLPLVLYWYTTTSVLQPLNPSGGQNWEFSIWAWGQISVISEKRSISSHT